MYTTLYGLATLSDYLPDDAGWLPFGIVIVLLSWLLSDYTQLNYSKDEKRALVTLAYVFKKKKYRRIYGLFGKMHKCKKPDTWF